MAVNGVRIERDRAPAGLASKPAVSEGGGRDSAGRMRGGNPPGQRPGNAHRRGLGPSALLPSPHSCLALRSIPSGCWVFSSRGRSYGEGHSHSPGPGGPAGAAGARCLRQHQGQRRHSAAAPLFHRRRGPAEQRLPPPAAVRRARPVPSPPRTAGLALRGSRVRAVPAPPPSPAGNLPRTPCAAASLLAPRTKPAQSPHKAARPPARRHRTAPERCSPSRLSLATSARFFVHPSCLSAHGSGTSGTPAPCTAQGSASLRRPPRTPGPAFFPRSHHRAGTPSYRLSDAQRTILAMIISENGFISL